VFDDLKIRNKLVLLVAGPLVIIILLAAMGAQDRRDTASASRNVERLAGLARANSDVVDALQRESLYSTSFVGSDREAWQDEMAASRTNTDTVMTQALALQSDLLGTSAAFRSASTLAADAADKLTYIRSAVDQGYRWDQVATTYEALQSTFLEVNDAIASTLTDPQVANDLRTAGALAAFKATISQQGAVMVGAAEAGVDTRSLEVIEADDSATLLPVQTLSDMLVVLQAEEDTSFKLLNSVADTQRKGEIRNALTSPARTQFEETRSAIYAAGNEPGSSLSLDSAAIIDSTVTQLEDLHVVEIDLYDDVIARAAASRSEAESAANRFILGGLVALAAAIVAAVLLARRITRPLDHLTEAADRLSTEQMPRLVEWLRNPSDDDIAFEAGALTAIEIESNDEIGKLATSFNEVQRVAGEVAAEQAALLRKGIGEMFVNLARRNQALLDRQIDFIDELERGEEDPDQLENLYKLDHLATRMRRNAESLLVLAGAEPPRRRGRPAPLANVVRAALAEVEDFGRIDLLSFDEILVASNVAADLAHLLSELMENATNFSPPETRVEVVGHRTKSEGYVISVTDHGIGMSADQIAEANESLAKPPLVGLALSRSLGFIVVGRLAGRHGISVRVMQSPSGGVTAVVTVPAPLITDTPGGVAADAGNVTVPRSAPPAPAPTASAAPAAPPAEAAPAPVGTDGLPPLTFDPVESPAPSEPAPPPAAEPAAATGPVARPAPEVPATDPSTGLPNRRAKAGDDGLPNRRASQEPAAEAAATEAPTEAPAPAEEPPPAPAASAPAVDAPEGLPSTNGTEPEPEPEPVGHLDGPPPAAPSLPPRARPAASTVETPPLPGAAESKPFFLEEAEPPRLFGRTAEPEAAPEPPAAPAAPPTPPAAPAPPAPAPEPAPQAPAAAVATAPEAPAPVKTASGLAKRTPRAAGASRAIPGADGERGVSATRRSPDEVRNLLSGFRAGQQRARTEDPVAAGIPEEKEPND
jgi:signal transduction histidine kinase